MLKLVSGNPGKRKLNASEPVPPAAPPVAEIVIPAVVREDAGALAEWNRIVPPMTSSGLVRGLDLGVVAQWCITWAAWIRVVDYLAKNGHTYEIKKVLKKTGIDEKGKSRRMDELVTVDIKTRPESAEFRRLQSILIPLGRELGLTPSARTRIKGEGPTNKPKDSADALRSKFFKSG